MELICEQLTSASEGPRREDCLGADAYESCGDAGTIIGAISAAVEMAAGLFIGLTYEVAAEVDVDDEFRSAIAARASALGSDEL